MLLRRNHITLCCRTMLKDIADNVACICYDFARKSGLSCTVNKAVKSAYYVIEFLRTGLTIEVI